MLTALAMAASMAACGDKKTDETAADSTEVAMTEAGTESTEAETESEEVLPEGMYRSLRGRSRSRPPRNWSHGSPGPVRAPARGVFCLPCDSRLKVKS